MSQMVCHTCFNNTSYHGQKGSELKSGICKYMRRGETDKMTWCVMELARFHDLVVEDPKSRAKGLVTNLVNRLKILLMEEILPSEIGIIARGIELLDEYEASREKRELLLEFCDLVSKAKRTRTVSYVGNWWRTRECELPLTQVAKCEKYRKKGDSEELLILGENLIEWVEGCDERMFYVFRKMYEMEEKAGTRFRRKDGVYLWWEILGDYMADRTEMKAIYDFALKMFFRKGMTERWAFGVWIGVIVWRGAAQGQGLLTMEMPQLLGLSLTDADAYYEAMEAMTLDEYVVQDYHVNKSLGLGHFAKNGAFVKDEDLSLMDDGEAYRKYYIQVKVEKDQAKKPKKPKKAKKAKKPKKAAEPKKAKKVAEPKKVKKVAEPKKVKKAKKVKVDSLETEGLQKIAYGDLSDVKVIEEGVCGGKVPCVMVMYEGEKYILKQVGKSMNFGADYLIVDQAKSVFGLRDMSMTRILMDRELVRKDKSVKTFVNNWEFAEGSSVYCMMRFFENVGDLGKNKGFLKDESVVRECLKIRLVDGLFRSSDNILRNILVDAEGQLLSIDEGDLFGKRERIFNKRGDWCQQKNVSDEILKEVLAEILKDGELKVDVIKGLMVTNGLDHGAEFEKRFMGYEEIVMSEW